MIYIASPDIVYTTLQTRAGVSAILANTSPHCFVFWNNSAGRMAYIYAEAQRCPTQRAVAKPAYAHLLVESVLYVWCCLRDVDWLGFSTEMKILHSRGFVEMSVNCPYAVFVYGIKSKAASINKTCL